MWSISTFVFFGTLIIIVSIMWPARRGAPWAPTTMRKVHKMLRLADVGPNDLVYDLGCGDGRIIIAAARRYGAQAVGVEIDPLRYLWCQVAITVLGLRGRVKIVLGDFFAQDLSDADVVTCYLMPVTNKKLVRKFSQELKPKTRIVSHDFVFPKLQLIRTDADDDLFLYYPHLVT
ncbi:MAG: methyltransferase domain-containing protein [Chloroflexota bacterium]